MPERRKSPRYSVHLPVYFPREKQWGYTSNLSLDGCYVIVKTSISEGLITDMLLELPVVGAVALKGYAQHKENEVPGIGLQFVQVRFAADQSEYYNLYSRFFRIMRELEDIRGDYLALVQEGRLKLCSLPKVRPIFHQVVPGEDTPEKNRQ